MEALMYKQVFQNECVAFLPPTMVTFLKKWNMDEDV
jgi:hypothetical protein